MGGEAKQRGDDIFPGRKGCHPSPGVYVTRHPPGVFAFNRGFGMTDLFRALGYLLLAALFVFLMALSARAGNGG